MLRRGDVFRSHFPEPWSQDLKPGQSSTYPYVSLRVVARVVRWWATFRKSSVSVCSAHHRRNLVC